MQAQSMHDAQRGQDLQGCILESGPEHELAVHSGLAPNSAKDDWQSPSSPLAPLAWLAHGAWPWAQSSTPHAQAQDLHAYHMEIAFGRKAFLMHDLMHAPSCTPLGCPSLLLPLPLSSAAAACSLALLLLAFFSCMRAGMHSCRTAHAHANARFNTLRSHLLGLLLLGLSMLHNCIAEAHAQHGAYAALVPGMGCVSAAESESQSGVEGQLATRYRFRNCTAYRTVIRNQTDQATTSHHKHNYMI